MKLYHGSNVAVSAPRILVTNRLLDFGAGFYLTSSQKQSETWSKIQTARRGLGVPTVSVFDFDDSNLSRLDVLRFELERLNVDVLTETNVKSISKGFVIHTDKMDVASENVVEMVTTEGEKCNTHIL